jgi:hypothetical protein
MWLRYMTICLVTLLIGLGSVLRAETLTSPPESLNGLHPGSLTLSDLTKKYGDPTVKNKGSLLQLYGGSANSSFYGWFMVPNPSYTIPDLAVETAAGSDKIDLVMAIGYDGLKTQKGIACFQSSDDLVSAYGKPDFIFEIPMQRFILHEYYYTKLGISFDVAIPSQSGGTGKIVAIYVTYPEFLQRAIALRKQYIGQGTGKDATASYQGGVSV